MEHEPLRQREGGMGGRERNSKRESVKNSDRTVILNQQVQWSYIEQHAVSTFINKLMFHRDADKLLVLVHHHERVTLVQIRKTQMTSKIISRTGATTIEKQASQMLHPSP